MNKFPKEERLKSRKQILNLFHEGKASKSGPIKIIWNTEQFNPEEENPHYIEITFSVPKRNFKKAVKRNLIKRRLREIYRLNKKMLNEYLSFHELRLYMIAIYLSNKEPSYHQLEKHMLKAFKELLDALKFESIKKYK